MKEYVNPEMEVVEFENEDVITCSGCNAKTEDYVCCEAPNCDTDGWF